MTEPAAVVDIVREFPDTHWADGPTRAVEPVLEGGAVLAFPHLAFAFADAERRFLDPRWADGKAKNISVRWPSGEMRGAAGDAADLIALRALIVRYTECSEALALRLFPHYRGQLRRGNTSFRPVDVAGRATSWRQDDTRLHIDAFPSNPMHGTRLLRVFCNVNPNGRPREWRVGEPFEAHARRYLGQIARPWPGSAWLLEKTGITKRRRTEYDHVMLQLHDRAKADAEFQRNGPQARVDFAPGTTWV
ncbi:MAG TPA: Kdo hydroxylase family protein, partial [Burkholderiaceae bacterium]|nr:Kdo hydroxylase family protein [Burkholderiaceae bacterium]